MKTFKTLVLFAGIIIGILAVISSPVKADNTKENNINTENKASFNLAEVRETEAILLDNYIQMQELSKNVETIKIVNQEGKTVFSGAESEAEDLIKISTLLFKSGNETHYLVVK